MKVVVAPTAFKGSLSAAQAARAMAGALGSIRHVDLSGLGPRLHAVRVEVIRDVDNPLLGSAWAIRSLPCKITGKLCACTGVII